MNLNKKKCKEKLLIDCTACKLIGSPEKFQAMFKILLDLQGP